MRTPIAVFAQRKASGASKNARPRSSQHFRTVYVGVDGPHFHLPRKKPGMGIRTPGSVAAGFALVWAVKSDVTIKPGTTVKLNLLHAPTQPA